MGLTAYNRVRRELKEREKVQDEKTIDESKEKKKTGTKTEKKQIEKDL